MKNTPKTIESVAFGSRLKSLRVEAGITQTFLAEVTMIPSPVLSRFETGDAYPDYLELRRILLALGPQHISFLMDIGPATICNIAKQC